MKKAITINNVIGLFLLMAISAVIGQNPTFDESQVDLEAKKLLDATSSKLDAQSAIKVDFDLEMIVPGQEADVQEGVLLQKGDNFLFDIESQMIVSNAKAVYVYMKDDNEIQINDPDFGEDGSLLSPAQMMRLYETESFFYAITDVAGNLTKIEFKPEDEYSDYSKLRLSVDHNLKEIRKMEIFSKDGTRINLKVKNLDLEPELTTESFSFDVNQFPGTYIEDLRID